jgi:hypothetical protein
VLMAEGEEPSPVVSVVVLLLNDICCSKPDNQSKPSSSAWPLEMSVRPCEKGESGSIALEGGESL